MKAIILLIAVAILKVLPNGADGNAVVAKTKNGNEDKLKKQRKISIAFLPLEEYTTYIPQ